MDHLRASNICMNMDLASKICMNICRASNICISTYRAFNVCENIFVLQHACFCLARLIAAGFFVSSMGSVVTDKVNL